jgi:antitoxin VapB
MIWTAEMVEMKKEWTASLFANGGSQAVRLPRECRFEGTAVRVRREGRAVVLEPLEKREWPAAFWDALFGAGPASDDFAVPEPLAAAPHRDAVLEELDGRS